MHGTTSVSDLPDQLRLLTTKLTHRAGTRFVRRFQTSALQNYDLQFASASARGGRELGAFVRPNDERFPARPPARN
jgi:hypothetical protein